jgi:hypothetical protein
MPILAIATTVLQLLPALLQAGIDVMGLLQSTNKVITDAQAAGRDPTDAEWNALDAQIGALRAQLNAP